MPSEQLSDEEKKPTDEVSMRKKDSIPNYTTGTEEMENKHVSISSSCQYLENRVAGKKVKYNLMHMKSKHKLFILLMLKHKMF